MRQLVSLKERGELLSAEVARVTRDGGGQPLWVLSAPDFPDAVLKVKAKDAKLPPDLMPAFVGQAVEVAVKGVSAEEVFCTYGRDPWPCPFAEGEEVECVVRAILPPREDGKPSGLLVDAGEGLLVEVPRAQATWSVVVPLRAQFVPGQKVRAKVVSAPKAEGEPLVLSVKSCLPDPWERADYRPGDFVAGVVVGTNREKNHVFVEVEPGIVGLAPYPLRGEVKRRDRVSCAVASFKKEEKKLHLRLRGFIERR